MPESDQLCFELPIHLPVKRTSRELVLKVVRRKKIQGNEWKVPNTTGGFLAQLHPSTFILKIFFLMPKVCNS